MLLHFLLLVYCSIFGDTLLMCCASVASYPVPIHSCANPLKYHPNTCRSMQNLKVQFYVHTTKHLNCNYDHRTNGNVPLHGNVEQSLLWMKHWCFVLECCVELHNYIGISYESIVWTDSLHWTYHTHTHTQTHTQTHTHTHTYTHNHTHTHTHTHTYIYLPCNTRNHCCNSLQKCFL